MALENIHITYLKEFIDQLIINKGVIKVRNPELVIEKVKIDFLVKLAFRFYSKLYNSEKYSSYLLESEKNQFEDCDIAHQPIIQSVFNTFNSNHQNEDVQCLNCGKEIRFADLVKSGDNLPICKDCHDEIGMEIDIWEKIFG